MPVLGLYCTMRSMFAVLLHACVLAQAALVPSVRQHNKALAQGVWVDEGEGSAGRKGDPPPKAVGTVAAPIRYTVVCEPIFDGALICADKGLQASPAFIPSDVVSMCVVCGGRCWLAGWLKALHCAAPLQSPSTTSQGLNWLSPCVRTCLPGFAVA